MKAIVHTEYGTPDVLQLQEVPTPVPAENQALVRVHAASVNRSDWEGLTGRPLYARLGGLRTPGHSIPGSDIAGRVEAVGGNVKDFQPRDDVFGLLLSYRGGFAEYACISEKVLALKPAGMTFEEAAAIPQAAVIAVQGIRHIGQVQPGQRVLINGAGGGAGSFAVQLAKLYGAEVTGVDNTGKLDFMRSLGADHVVDYTREDFTRNRSRYDLILDMVARRSVFAYARALRPEGRAFAVGGSMMTLFQSLLLGGWVRRATGKTVKFLAVPTRREDLLYIAELYQAGKFVLPIDKRYPLSEAPAALRYLGEGHAKGKVVISIVPVQVNSRG